MDIILIITVGIFLFNLLFLYRGAVGRIERRNQLTGKYQDLGPVSEKEEIAFMDGTHKSLAFFQALIGAFLWSFIAYGLMLLIENMFIDFL